MHRNMKPWNSWIIYISWFYYADEAMMTNQLDTVTNIDCKFAPHSNKEKHKEDRTQPYFNCTQGFQGKALLESYEFTLVWTLN